MNQFKENLEYAINLLKSAKQVLEKELNYGYETTDELDTILDSLQFELDMVNDDLEISGELK